MEDRVEENAKLVSCVDHVALRRVVRKIPDNCLDIEEVGHHVDTDLRHEVLVVYELVEVVRELLDDILVAVDAVVGDGGELSECVGEVQRGLQALAVPRRLTSHVEDFDELNGVVHTRLGLFDCLRDLEAV